MMSKIQIVILIIIGFVLGYFVGSVTLVDLKFISEINLLDLLTLLFTVFLALYIPTAIEKNIANKRYERNILNDRINIIQNCFKDIKKQFYKTYRQGTLDQDTATSIIDNFQSISTELDALLKLSTRVCPETTTANLKRIIVLRGQYKKIITGGNFGHQGFQYTINHKIKADKAFSIIDTELSFLMFDVYAV